MAPTSDPIDVQPPEALFDLTGRTAIVTGSSSGLGRRFAMVLHRAGANVVVTARRGAPLEALAETLSERVAVVVGDVADVAVQDSCVEAALGFDGSLDVLVNNAGTGKSAPAEDESLDDFRQTMTVNVEALFSMSQRCGRVMLETESGSIVNIASILGLVASAPIPQASYCASKGAVVSLTRELGAQWARRGVRVNAIAPGWFRSEMTEATMFDDPSGQNYIRKNCPTGRAGREDEMDGALLFLASAASSYVTGQTISVDGGWAIS